MIADECHKNIEEKIAHPFWSKPIHTETFGPHVWGMWSKPAFRGTDLKKVGKKSLELGRYYQGRTCENCGLVEEVMV